MAQQTVNIGTAANDGTGDPVRTAGTKINANFTELYGLVYTNALARAAIHAAPSVVTGTAYTLVLGDAYQHLRTTNAAAVTLTVPPNASVAFGIGAVVAFRQSGAGLATLVAGAGVTLNSRGGLLNSGGQHAGFQIKKIATDEWDVWGDVA